MKKLMNTIAIVALIIVALVALEVSNDQVDQINEAAATASQLRSELNTERANRALAERDVAVERESRLAAVAARDIATAELRQARIDGAEAAVQLSFALVKSEERVVALAGDGDDEVASLDDDGFWSNQKEIIAAFWVRGE